METIIAIHNESEYNEILRQAVAVIETAKSKAALLGFEGNLSKDGYVGYKSLGYEAVLCAIS